MPPDELVVGVGIRPGTPADRIVDAVREALGTSDIGVLATVDRRSAEPGLLAAAAELSVPIVAFTAAELAGVEVPTPSRRTIAALGTPSVAEASAILAGGRLARRKRTIRGVVVAVATRADSAK